MILQFIRSIRTHGPTCWATADELFGQIVANQPGTDAFGAKLEQLHSYLDKCELVRQDPDISVATEVLVATHQRAIEQRERADCDLIAA